MTTSPLAARLAAGPQLGVTPAVVDVPGTAPANPPERLQVEFVGLSALAAYEEADRFVTAVAEQLARLGHPGLGAGRILDFGAGWGRISRVLLAQAPPTQLFSLDVDPEMTALLNATLPGINAMTVSPLPPTVLGGATMDVALAFSVFSHLSGDAHRQWAAEFGRVVRPGGVAAVTVLGADFIDLVAGAAQDVAAGRGDTFSTQMSTVFDDPAAAREGFHADQVQFGATGGGGVRTSDYYGWAVTSRRALERIWGDAGFEVVRWWPSGELFPQALAVLVRTDRGPWLRRLDRARRAARHTVARSLEQRRGALPGPVRAVARAARALR